MEEWKEVDFEVENFPFEAVLQLQAPHITNIMYGRFSKSYFGKVSFMLDEPQLPTNFEGWDVDNWKEYKWRLNEFQHTFAHALSFSSEESPREKANEIMQIYPKVKSKRAKRAKKQKAV